MKRGNTEKWLRGYLICETASGSWERFMNMCRHHGIELWKIKRDTAVKFCVRQSGFKKLVPIVRKTGARPHITGKKGLPFVLDGWIKDWTFYSGFLLFLGTLALLGAFVWEITYSGQSSYTKETLSKTVEAMGVREGMRRSGLDCDAIEKQIRQVYPDISWVSAEEKGSVLQISIKEGKKTVVHENETEAGHLVASSDGIVEQIVANRGTVVVEKGQNVKKGDILISGLVPVTDDNNEVTENIAVAAKGDVTLLVTEEKTEEIPIVHKVKEYTGRVVKTYRMVIGGNSIFVKNPFKRLDNSMKYDILKKVCMDRTIHPLSLSLNIQTSEYLEYQWKETRYSEAELKAEGMKRYQKLFLTSDGEEKELVEHEAVMKKSGEDAWLLHARISYRSHEMEWKPVTKEEINDIKPDGGQDGESGDNS